MSVMFTLNAFSPLSLSEKFAEHYRRSKIQLVAKTVYD